jgi:hypothetical protein
MLIRIAKYSAVLIVVLIVFIYLAGLLVPDIFNSEKSNSLDKSHSIINTVVVSPVIESVILYILWKLIVGSSELQYKRVLFILVTSVISFAAHGGSFGSIFPTTMFIVCAVFIDRTIVVYKYSKAKSISGVIAIHIIYNVFGIELKAIV